MAMKIDNVTIPESIRLRGRYKFDPPAVLFQNGEDQDVTAGYSSVVWRFDDMPLSDYTWFITTILGGAASKECTSNRLFDHLQVETAYSTCILHRPTYEAIQRGLYQNVEVQITQIQV